MDVITETIDYSKHVCPFRYGLRWLGISLAITLPIASLFLRSDAADFFFVCIAGVCPVSLIAFISPWSRARELAKKSHTITLSRDQLTVDETIHDLSTCRWFRGWTFHQPELSRYPTFTPAVVLTWQPFSENRQVICGLTTDTRNAIIERLSHSPATEDPPRRRSERRIVTISTAVGALVTLALMTGINCIAGSRIPEPSIALTVVVGSIVFRVLTKYRLGFVQFQETPIKQFSALLTLIVLGTLRLNRRWRGGPVHQNDSLFAWVLPLAAFQIGALAVMYIWVRSQENVRLDKHSLVPETHS